MSDVRQNRTFGVVLRILAVVASIVFLFAYMAYTEWANVRGNPFFLMAGIAVCGGFFWTWGSRHLAPLAEEVLQSDPRPPVIYLRSFANEKHASEAEQSFAKMFEPIGPFIAIGAPGERLPPLGAARLYLDDDNWQAKVSEFLQKAKLVLIYGGDTPGLGWEVSQVRERLHPSRVVIMIPNDEAGYEKFRETVNRSTRLGLPKFPSGDLMKYATPGVAGFLSFDDSWRPLFSPMPKAANRGRGTPYTYSAESGRAWAALSEIYAQIGIAVPKPKRNWMMVYFSIARIYVLILLAVLVICVALWAMGVIGLDDQEGPYWVGFDHLL